MSDPSVPENYDELLDASGLNCPLPLLKTKQSLNKLASGQVLKVIATDAGSWRDIQVFVNNSVNELLCAEQDKDQYCYWIKKGIVND
ncbi:sulfurtransferase TusA family protein [Litoribrevibacter albus]|uniref:Transcriptional regulator n=1 Tax=Litoribrevibacter albus TaxID=1473156 RepID=A0AA37SAC0_9GAMM|nr:sulfurtransferase TusA family protein [Litoribrevibacter albus]GLQ31235.1 transcriptional regulator [Litoribrevibacter albus]